MPQLNLAELSAQQLRHELDSSRARGDAALAYSILQEMAARREAGGARKRRADEPRVVSFELPDLDKREELPPMPKWRPPAERGPPEPQPEAAADVEPEDDLRMPAARPESPPRRKGGRAAPAFALGLTLGLALGVAGGWFALSARPVAAIPAQAAPAPTLPIETPAPEALVPVEVAEAPPPPALPEPVEAPADACAREPTPADRAICADPDLRRLQRELREAYAQALDAHADRALLRQRQLAWRDARSDVSDPGRLARLYEQRIRKLNAAAAAALAQRSSGGPG